MSCKDPDCPACILRAALERLVEVGAPSDMLVAMTMDVLTDVIYDNFKLEIEFFELPSSDEETVH
jgi:hypothetical protein